MIFLAAFVLLILWLPIIWLLGAQWSIYEQYRYGWAVPLLCAYLFWKRWRSRSSLTTDLRTLTSNNSAFPFPFSAFVLLIVIPCLLLLPTRVLQEANPLWRFASYALTGEAILITLALLYIAGGFCALRHFAFPVCLFLVAVPWPTPVEVTIINSLTHLNTAAVIEVMNALGIPSIARGNVIEVSTGLVGVDEACSGIRSTQAVFMLALFFGELHRLCVRARFELLASGLLIALVLNIVRTSILVILAARGGIALSQKWHDTTGITVLLGCFLLVWTISTWLSRKQPSPELGSAGDSPKTSTFNSAFCFPLSTFSPRSVRFASVAVFLSSLLSIIGSELWFRAHERKNATIEQWTITLPRERSAFHESTPSKEVQSALQYDSAETAAWQNHDGALWHFFHFRWNPAAGLKDRVRVHLAKSHRPEACLPAGGWKLRREFPGTEIKIAGIPLLFRTYEFTAGPRTTFVFFCVREDGHSNITANMRESHAVRWRAAWEGNRGLGQRSIEIAITSSRDLAHAETSLRSELPKLIQIQPH